MATTDIAPPVARMATLIEAIDEIGNVYPYEFFRRKSDATIDAMHLKISGVHTLRFWWISGPTMTAQRAVSGDGTMERSWEYTIHGAFGVTETGDSIELARTKALAVLDAIDAEHDLNGTCHRTNPGRFAVAPSHREILDGVGVTYVEIAKTVVSLSLP